MIRLIWVHEWAHALCGHVTMAQQDLGLSQLHESSPERSKDNLEDGYKCELEERIGVPYHSAMQAIELHADEFSIVHSIGGIFYGYDPIVDIAGPKISLVDRMSMLNIACCVFTVIWALTEFRQRRDVQSPKPIPPPNRSWSPRQSTHPPVGLRYDRFRGFQKQLTFLYGEKEGFPAFLPVTEILAVKAVRALDQMSPIFGSLLGPLSGFMFETLSMKDLREYESHLLAIEPLISWRLSFSRFDPTQLYTGT
jgi:hypothetical protein